MREDQQTTAKPLSREEQLELDGRARLTAKRNDLYRDRNETQSVARDALDHYAKEYLVTVTRCNAYANMVDDLQGSIDYYGELAEKETKKKKRRKYEQTRLALQLFHKSCSATVTALENELPAIAEGLAKAKAST